MMARIMRVGDGEPALPACVQWSLQPDDALDPSPPTAQTLHGTTPSLDDTYVEADFNRPLA